MKQLCASLILFLACLVPCRLNAAEPLSAEFAHPPLPFKSRPLWFWNARPTTDLITQTMQTGLTNGYAGFGILPLEQTALPFMGPEFLSAYRQAVDTAARLGQKMCLYDEYWFPSGSAGGLLRQRYPEALNKRLDHTEIDVLGPKEVILEVPAGELMAAVAINNKTWERLDLTAQVSGQRLTWKAPAGLWSLMAFACVPDGSKDLVDYLDADSVAKFVSLTYQGYFDAFGEHFGKTIDSAFYDEPTMHWIANGRAWTPGFNRKFAAVYHRSPATLYPALWRDIGPETAAARNLLFGFRARLFAEGFVKTLADWCAAKGIELTGHQDQEEVANPVCLSGDLIKCFQYQSIPGIDEIFTYARGSAMFKIVSSAAVNYGRARVMSETYGAMNNMPIPVLYQEAMDQFAKGINWLVPHAVWSDPAHIIFPPELSGRTAPYAAELPRFNEFVGRCQRLLQTGQPVVDLAVLYPIHDLQAATSFDGPLSGYNGVILPPWTDYQRVGECLSRELRLDFTYLHPETLDAHCQVEKARLRLMAPAIPQEYRVMILPGAQVISAANLKKVLEFYESGGQVIATTCLPSQSAELGEDAAVRRMVHQIFGRKAAAAGRVPQYPRIRASSVSAQFNSPHTPDKAFDQNPDTAWEPGASGEQWLEVDFGRMEPIISTLVTCQTPGRTGSHRWEYWDGRSWQKTGQRGDVFAAIGHVFGTTGVDASKVRLVVSGTNGLLPRIEEFEVHGLTGEDYKLAKLPALPPHRQRVYQQKNRAGGRAWFIENPDTEALATALTSALPQPDMGWTSRPVVTGGSLTCLHKNLGTRECYFYANSSTNEVNADVALRGVFTLECWDPHTSQITPLPVRNTNGTTRFSLHLPPVSARFFLSTQ